MLIAGAGGMLGQDLMTAFSRDEVFEYTKSQLDITAIDAVQKVVHTDHPDLIINAAAYTNVDGCESDFDLAYRVNALGPRNLAVAANQIGAAIVHISTDYVFPGNATSPYLEHDATGPLSVYGKSKLAGEQLIASLCSRHYIVRTAWLYGLHGKNFVRTMLQIGQKESTVRVVNDQLGSPTYTPDFAAGIAQLVRKPAYGIYHLTNQGTCTWYEFAKAIFEEANLSVHVEPITTADLNRPAHRPAYSVLDNFMWRLEGFAPLRHYRDALKSYIQDYNLGGTI